MAEGLREAVGLGARGPASASCVFDFRSHSSNLSGQGSSQYLSKGYVVIGKRLFILKL